MATHINDHPTLTHEAVDAALRGTEVSPLDLANMAIEAAHVRADAVALALIKHSQYVAAEPYAYDGMGIN